MGGKKISSLVTFRAIFRTNPGAFRLKPISTEARLLFIFCVPHPGQCWESYVDKQHQPYSTPSVSLLCPAMGSWRSSTHTVYPCDLQQATNPSKLPFVQLKMERGFSHRISVPRTWSVLVKVAPSPMMMMMVIIVIIITIYLLPDYVWCPLQQDSVLVNSTEHKP